MTGLRTENFYQKMTSWRHDLHNHPELGFSERWTSSRVPDFLEGFGAAVHPGIGQTGVVVGSARDTRPGSRTVSTAG